MDIRLLKEKLKNSAVFENEKMSEHTSFKTGGCADCFVVCESVEDLKEAISFFKESKTDYCVFGKGSNILVTDKGIRGGVIKLGEAFGEIKLVGEREILVGAASSMAAASLFAAENSLSGFEFASGIPGSFGGGIFMNAGAYDGEIKDVLVSVSVLDKDGEVKEISADDLELKYRKSNVEEKGFILLSGTIKLKCGKKEDIKAYMSELNARRRDKQPLNYPSAGSTFKRPKDGFAGKLIEESGLKGFSVGGAQVSEKHAGFVINRDNAKSEDILKLIDYCIKKVYEDTGITLEPEIRIIGER